LPPVDTTVLWVLSIALGIGLVLLHYFSHKVSALMEKYHYHLLSFSGGTLIAIIFLVLMPEVQHLTPNIFVFLMMLMGFVAFHLLSKYLYQHEKEKAVLDTRLKYLHALGFTVDHFMLGFLLVTTIELESFFGLIILAPIAAHTAMSSFSAEHIHGKGRSMGLKILLAISPMLGIIVALLVNLPDKYLGYILAFILGMLLYIVSRDVIPKKDKGYPNIFLAALIATVLLWMLMRYMGV